MVKGKPSAGASTDAATGGVERVESVTRGEVRRSYTPDEKAQPLTEAAALLLVTMAPGPVTHHRRGCPRWSASRQLVSPQGD